MQGLIEDAGRLRTKNVVLTKLGSSQLLATSYEKPLHGQAHLVFPTHKANAKKPKELALPHHHPEIKIIRT